ncbi:MAG TPA: hypothetical protein VKA70_18215 [Blastocatellia bacterium]|nr:hypothetical protein [Blastocatellia bacterium]
MRITKLLLIVSLIWVSALTASETLANNRPVRQMVLVDASGSMEGFFTTQEIHRLNNVLRNQPGVEPELYYFVDRSLVNTPPPPFGAYTMLENAMTRAIESEPSILWVVSDNQPSIGGRTASDADLERFYEILNSDVVKRICLFPLSMRFKGPLFTQDDRVLKADYDNQRGLLVYALLLDDTARDEFETAVRNVENRLGQDFNSRCILVKPLNRDTVTSSFKPGKKLQFKEGTGIVGRNFETGQTIEGDFTLELASQLGHIKIEESNINATTPVEFQTSDFSVSSIKPDISPKTVALSPKDKKQFLVTLQLNSVDIRITPQSLWNCITKNTGVIKGNIRITIEVPPENLNLVRNLIDQFSTEGDIYKNPDSSIQSRIYGLNSLMQRMMPSEGAIQPRVGNDPEGNIPVLLEVKYPKWPLLLALLLIGAPLLAVVGTALFVKRQPFYRLTWDGGRYRACDDFRLWPFAARAVQIDDRVAAKVKRAPLAGLRVVAQRGYMVDDLPSKLIRPEGADFVIRRQQDDAIVDFIFSNSYQVASREVGGDDLYDGIAYGEQASDTSGDYSAGAPPVRKVTTNATRPLGSGAPSEEGYEPYSF